MFIGTVCAGSPLNRAYPHFAKDTTSDNCESRTTRGADHQEIYKMIDVLNPQSVYIYALGFEPWLKFFLGNPIQRYADEFDLLKSVLMKDGINLKNLKFLVAPQNIEI